MAMILPDATALGERPAPQPNRQVAQYEPPNFRTVGMAGSIVEGAGNELGQAAQILDQTNAKYDAIAADNALNKLQTTKASLEFDPQSGFTTAKGANAVGPEFLQNYQGQFKDAVSQIGDGLQNQQQKQMFQQRAQMAGSQFQSSLLAHQAQQTTIYANDTDDASVKNALNDIAAHPYDDNAYQTNMNIANNALNSKASRSGYSAPMIDNARTALTSAALSSRTSGMMQDNPLQAADFFHQHELEFDANTHQRLSQELKTVTDAQTVRSGGQQAFQIGSSQASTSGAPVAQNMNADTVQPYSQQNVDDITKQVKAPSQYDSLFQKYGQIYNVSPTELKLRAVAESSQNPSAVSAEGAKGLMQITPATAKSLGIDPTDPEQAIKGAAMLMSQSGGTLGSDMGKVDRAYYSGNPNQQPNTPNTDQYVENLRAVRANLYGQAAAPQTVASLEGSTSSVIAQAKLLAQQQRPGDAVYAEQMVSEATKNLSQAISATRGQNYADFSNLLGQSIGQSGVKSISDLSPADQTTFSHLPPDNQHSLLNLWKSNQVQDDRVTPTQQTDQKSLALQGMAINDPYAFKNQDIVAATQGLPRQDQEKLYNMYMSIDKNMVKGANVTQAISYMSKDMETAKIPIPNASEKQSPATLAPYNAYTALLKNSIDNFMADNKRAPNQEEVLALGRPLLAQVQVPGRFYGTNSTPAFMVRPDQESQVTVPMQPAEVQQISGRLQQRYGYEPTQSQVQAFKTMSILHQNDPVALRQFDQTMRNSRPQGQSKPIGGAQ